MFLERSLGIHVQITQHQGAPHYLPLHHKSACRRFGSGLLAIGTYLSLHRVTNIWSNVYMFVIISEINVYMRKLHRGQCFV